MPLPHCILLIHWIVSRCSRDPHWRTSQCLSFKWKGVGVSIRIKSWWECTVTGSQICKIIYWLACCSRWTIKLKPYRCIIFLRPNSAEANMTNCIHYFKQSLFSLVNKNFHSWGNMLHRVKLVMSVLHCMLLKQATLLISTCSATLLHDNFSVACEPSYYNGWAHQISLSSSVIRAFNLYLGGHGVESFISSLWSSCWSYMITLLLFRAYLSFCNPFRSMTWQYFLYGGWLIFFIMFHV